MMNKIYSNRFYLLVYLFSVITPKIVFETFIEERLKMQLRLPLRKVPLFYLEEDNKIFDL